MLIEALADFEKAVAVKPNSMEFYLSLAKAKSGQLESAIIDFDPAIC